MNFTIPQPAMRAMLDRLQLAKSPEWFGTFIATSIDLEVVAIGDVLVEAHGPIEGHEDERLRSTVTLPLHDLDRWIDSVEGAIDVTNDLESGTVTFETNTATLPLFVVPDRSYVMPEQPDERMGLPTEVWGHLKRCAWAAAAVDRSGPSWKSMLHVSPGLVWTSDSYRLAMVEVDDLEAEANFWPNLAEVLDHVDLDACTLTVDDQDRLHVSDDAGRFVVSSFAGDPPTVAAIRDLAKPRGERHELTVNRADLLDALGKLKAIRAGDSTGVWLEVDSDVLTLTVVTGNNTPATREVPCKGSPPAVAFNLDYLRSAVNSLSGDAVLQIADDRNPAILCEDTYTALLMPIRGGAPARLSDRKRR